MLDELRNQTDDFRIRTLISKGKTLENCEAMVKRINEQLKWFADKDSPWIVDFKRSGNTAHNQFEGVVATRCRDEAIAALKDERQRLRDVIKGHIRFNGDDKTNGERWNEKRI